MDKLHVMPRRLRDDERGIGTVTALFVATTVFVLGATWTSLGVHQVESSSFERMREQALHAAEAGVNLAVSHLADDLAYPGTSGTVTLGDETGEFEVTVTPLDPTDPADLDRVIVAKGYAPSKAASRKAVRHIEQQVYLEPSGGFRYALFASPGGIVGDQHAEITGDAYSLTDVSLANFTNLYGDLVSRGTVTTANNNLVAGDIHALGSVVVDNSQTTVQGSVFSGANVSGTGRVDGDIQAAGSVSLTNVGGAVAAGSTPPEPPALSQPTFTWDAANYQSATSWLNAAAFNLWWTANASSMSGAHRVAGGDGPLNTVTIDKKITLTGDLTIVADGPIHISRDIANGTSGDVALTIITTSTDASAVKLTNNLTIPSTVKVLVFAPNGGAEFLQQKNFSGAVYAKNIELSQYFTLDYAPPSVPGFDWSASSWTGFEVEMRTFRELPAT